MHPPNPTPLDPPLDTSYGNHQKIMAYFSYLAPLVLFSLTKRQRQKRGARHNALTKYASAKEPETRNLRTNNKFI